METTDDTALYIGYLTIIIVVIIIVLNFGVLIINLFYGIATYICKFNTLGEMVKLGDLISEKIESIKMKEFTYEKVWKDAKTGLWYKQSMFNHRLVTFHEKATQYRLSDIKNKENKNKIQIPKIEKVIQILDLDKSQRKLKEEDMEIEMNHQNEDVKSEQLDFGNVSKQETTDFPNRIQDKKPQVKFKKR